MSTVAKEADLAGPGIGDYAEPDRVLPDDYVPLLSTKETMQGLYPAKRLIGLAHAGRLPHLERPQRGGRALRHLPGGARDRHGHLEAAHRSLLEELTDWTLGPTG